MTAIREGQPSGLRVGLIGAGAMGSALIGRLVANSYAVSVFDPSPAACERASADGAKCLPSAEAVFSTGDPVIICVASAHAFARTIDAALASHNSGARVAPIIEASTLSLVAKNEARSRLAECKIVLLDCPVSGTSAQARNRDLVVFASGDPASLSVCEPIFGAIARTVVRAGDFGMGMRLKLLANHLVGLHSAAAAEVLVLARKSGLDPEVALQALIQSAGNSRMLEVRGPLMIANCYLPATGSIDIIVKDGQMIKEMAIQANCGLPLFERAHELYQAAQKGGQGALDIAGVHGFLLENSCNKPTEDCQGK